MKTNRSQLFAMLLLGVTMSCGVIARAEDAPAKPAPAPGADVENKGPASRPKMREQMDKMYTAIKATDEQKEKLKAIFKARNEKMKPVREDTSLSREDRMAKRKEIVEASDVKVKELLSADQFEEYQKFQKEQAKLFRGQRPAAADKAPKN